MRARSIALVVVAVAIAAIGVGISLAWHDARQDNAKSQRFAEAVAAGARIDTELGDALALANTARSIVETGDAAERTELERAAQRAFADPHIVGVAWGPQVGSGSEERFPATLVASRDEAIAEGADLAGLPGAAVALQEARASGASVLAAPEEEGSLVLVREAVRRTPEDGAVPGAIAVMIEPEALGAAADLSSGVEVRDSGTVLVDGIEAGASGSTIVDVGGREWLVVFSTDSPSLLVPALVLSLIVLAALVVVAVAVAGAVRERRLRGEADRDASRAEALRQLAEGIAGTEAGRPVGIPELAAAAARAASDASSAGVIQFSADGPRELASVGVQNGHAEAVCELVDEVGVAGTSTRRTTDGGVIAATPVRVDDETWGAIWVDGAPEAAADPSSAAHVLGIGLGNLHRRAELRVQARTDALTGLANRRSYMEQLRREVALAKRRGRSLSVAMLDIDHFKAVNDEFGHPAGDHTLAELATRLTAVARASDLVARVGGEEFAWLMPEASLAEAWQAAERARRAMSAHPMPGGVGTVTISLGVADLQGASSAEELYANADAALYAAKTAGRDLVAVHEPDVEIADGRALGTEVDGRDAQRARAIEVAAGIATSLGWDDGRVAKVRASAALDVTDASAPEWVASRTLRWDGGPKGEHPRGDEIPQEARVLAVADAWAALVGEGADDPRIRTQALAAIRAASGTAFWPAAVEALGPVFAGHPTPAR